MILNGRKLACYVADFMIDVIDITGWQRDPKFPIFPQGARAKTAVFAPASPLLPGLRPRQRYLFKYSLPRYPEEFWSEIVAQIVGKRIGVPVPTVFLARDGSTGYVGALIEWFYNDGAERMVPGGDMFQRLIPGFDRKRGTQHNVRDILRIRDLYQDAGFKIAASDEWRVNWARMLFFDALIGNGDRHQDNWALLVDARSIRKGRFVRLAPAFDNGSSMGREITDERAEAFTDQDIDRYVARGRHHVKWARSDAGRTGHVELVRRLAVEWKAADTSLRRMADISIDPILSDISALSEASVSVPLTPTRINLMLRLLVRRSQLLRQAVQSS